MLFFTKFFLLGYVGGFKFAVTTLAVELNVLQEAVTIYKKPVN